MLSRRIYHAGKIMPTFTGYDILANIACLPWSHCHYIIVGGSAVGDTTFLTPSSYRNEIHLSRGLCQ